MLRNDCQVQVFESVNALTEAACWGMQRSVAATGQVIDWDLIHFNEGLHSLWPRTNISDASGVAFAGALANWTRVLASPGPSGVAPTLIYATMTPMMEAHYCNPPGPPQSTVEDLNALAVKTVQAQGVTLIHDLYSVVTGFCGPKYFNCSICDNESAYACPSYAKMGGICGFHYTEAGWELLANSTATVIRESLHKRRAALP